MNTLLIALTAIFAASALCVILFGVWQCLTPCGWHKCPECSWWQHDNGLYSDVEPETWDGVLSERVCTSCQSIQQKDFSQGIEPLLVKTSGRLDAATRCSELTDGAEAKLGTSASAISEGAISEGAR